MQIDFQNTPTIFNIFLTFIYHTKDERMYQWRRGVGGQKQTSERDRNNGGDAEGLRAVCTVEKDGCLALWRWESPATAEIVPETEGEKRSKEGASADLMEVTKCGGCCCERLKTVAILLAIVKGERRLPVVFDVCVLGFSEELWCCSCGLDI